MSHSCLATLLWAVPVCTPHSCLVTILWVVPVCTYARPSILSRPSTVQFDDDDDDVFYLFFQKQKIALGHIPFGYTRSRELNTLPVNHPQCPFIQTTDTDVTFLSCYNFIGHIRMDVMTLTSPPSLPLSRPWAGLSRRRLTESHLLIEGPPLLSSLPYSLSVFWMHAKN